MLNKYNLTSITIIYNIICTYDTAIIYIGARLVIDNT